MALLRGADNRLISPQSRKGRGEEPFLLSGERPESKKSFFICRLSPANENLISAFSVSRTSHASGLTSGW